MNEELELAELNQSFPVVEGNSRISLPRFGMLSKDIVKETGNGKNKKIKVIEAAGTFFTEEDSGEEVKGDDGKVRKVWKKNFIEGETVDVIIAYHRKQLRYFDKGLNKFISSPIFDRDDQVISLFLDKRVIAKGTKDELQARYPALTQKGRKTSDLKQEKILYIIYKQKFYQMTLTISSGWAFDKYAKSFKEKTSPATVVTSIGSIEETNGSNTYRKATFKSIRPIDREEVELVKENQGIIKSNVESDNKFFLDTASSSKADKEFDAIGESK